MTNDVAGSGTLDASTISIDTNANPTTEGTCAVNGSSPYDITFTPIANFVDTATCVYEICNTNSLCDTATITFDPADGSNPVAVNDTATTQPDTAVTVNVFSNDTDPDGNGTLNQASINVTVDANTGTEGTCEVVNAPLNEVRFTPVNGFLGTASCTYEVCDSNLNTPQCDTAILAVTVNTPPTATDDSASDPDFGDPVVISEATIMTNDTAGSGTLVASTISIDTDANNATEGACTVSGSSPYDITFTPIANFVDTATCVYEICNSNSLCDTAMITFDPADGSAPVANNDTATTAIDTAVSVDVTTGAGADIDADGNLDTSSVTLTANQPNPTTEGACTVSSPNVTFTPVSGFTGVASCEYQVCDSNLNTPQCDTATLAVTVNAACGAASSPIVFNYTASDQPYTFPTDTTVTHLYIKAWGAGGGADSGNVASAGPGGFTEAIFTPTNGDQFSIVVGRGGTGYQPGGCGTAGIYGFGGCLPSYPTDGNGGGLSGLFTGTTTVAETDQARAVLIAGGGGGGDYNTGHTAPGGSGNDPLYSGGESTMRGQLDFDPSGIFAGGGGGYAGGSHHSRNTVGSGKGANGGSGFVLGSAVFSDILFTPEFSTLPPKQTDTDYVTEGGGFGEGVDFNTGIVDGANGLVVITEMCAGNDNPPFAANNTGTTNEGVAATFDVGDNDADVDGDLDLDSITITTQAPGSEGTCTASTNGEIDFVSANGFTGETSCEYQICDSSGTRCDTATLFVTVAPAEICDNGLDDDGDGLTDLFDTECNASCNPISSLPMPTSLVEVSNIVARYDSATVLADFDNDGDIESLQVQPNNYTVTIGDLQTGTVEMTQNLTTTAYGNHYYMAAANIDSDPELEFVANYQGYGRPGVFEHDGTLKWQAANADRSTNAINGSPGTYGPYGFADFDQDGNSELYTSSAIWNAQTGALIGRATEGVGAIVLNNVLTNGRSLGVDLLPDSACSDCSGLEWLAGKSIYSVNVSTGTITEVMSAASHGFQDGPSIPVDWNADGKLDVVLVDRLNRIIVWDITNDTILGTVQLPTSLNRGQISMTPAIADIDGDGFVELAIGVGTSAHVYENDLSLKWSHGYLDSHNAISPLLADLNSDGILELVVKNASHFYIVNALDGTELISNTCGSGSGSENISFIDADGDGAGEIVIECGQRIRTFEGNTPFGPARAIRNQFMYTGVNVNDDGSIPQYQMQDAQPSGINWFHSQYPGPLSELSYDSNSGEFLECIPPATPPTAVNNTSSDVFGATQNITDVTANDTAGTNPIDTGSVTITADANNSTEGSCSVTTSPEVEFVPVSNFAGTATCTYQVCDNASPANCDTADLEFTVGAGSFPVANNDSESTAVNTPVTVNVISNDTDPDGNGTLNQTSIVVTIDANNSSEGTCEVVNAPLNEVRFTPVAAFTGTANCTYEVCDSNIPTPQCDTANLAVTVNTPPTATDDSASDPDFGDAVVISEADILTNDTAGSGTLDASTISIDTNANPTTEGTCTVNGSSPYDITFTPIANFVDTATCVYEICNSNGLCDTASITFDPEDGSAPVANNDTAITSIDTAVSVDVTAGAGADTDADGNLDTSSVTLTANQPNPTTEGACTVSSPNVTFTPVSGFTGVASCEYQVCDSNLNTAQCDTATLAVTVNAACGGQKYIYSYEGVNQHYPFASYPDTNGDKTVSGGTIDSTVTHIHVKAWGAGGGGNANGQAKGGAGGYSEHIFPISTSDASSILVGEGGGINMQAAYGGGGAGGDGLGTRDGGSGGGRSSFFLNSTEVLIAGGGGGGGGNSNSAEGDNGGIGGHPNGEDGGVKSGAIPATGGTQSNGGLAGTGQINGTNGSALLGGNGGGSSSSNGGGGGGGGGYFGGGGGAGSSSTITTRGGGAGGSSFGPSGANYISGSGINAPNQSDEDYSFSAGSGGATTGGDGLIVVVELCAGNDNAPFAAIDRVSTTPDTNATYDVVANDVDIDGDLDLTTLAIDSNAPSGEGTCSIGSNPGEIDFAPASGFTGTTSCVYEICDSSGTRCDTATLEVTITPPTCMALVDPTTGTQESYPLSYPLYMGASCEALNNDAELEAYASSFSSSSATINDDGGLAELCISGLSAETSSALDADGDGEIPVSTQFMNLVQQDPGSASYTLGAASDHAVWQINGVHYFAPQAQVTRDYSIFKFENGVASHAYNISLANPPSPVWSGAIPSNASTYARIDGKDYLFLFRSAREVPTIEGHLSLHVFEVTATGATEVVRLENFDRIHIAGISYANYGGKHFLLLTSAPSSAFLNSKFTVVEFTLPNTLSVLSDTTLTGSRVTSNGNPSHWEIGGTPYIFIPVWGHCSTCHNTSSLLYSLDTTDGSVTQTQTLSTEGPAGSSLFSHNGTQYLAVAQERTGGGTATDNHLFSINSTTGQLVDEGAFGPVDASVSMDSFHLNGNLFLAEAGGNTANSTVFCANTPTAPVAIQTEAKGTGVFGTAGYWQFSDTTGDYLVLGSQYSAGSNSLKVFKVTK